MSYNTTESVNEVKQHKHHKEINRIKPVELG